MNVIPDHVYEISFLVNVISDHVYEISFLVNVIPDHVYERSFLMNVIPDPVYEIFFPRGRMVNPTRLREAYESMRLSPRSRIANDSRN